MSTVGIHHRVLMISAAFPPAGGAGVQRPVKFAKYLGRFGWDPMVWTVGTYAGLPHDPTLLVGLPESVRVVRFPNGESEAVKSSSGLRGIWRTAARSGIVPEGLRWRIKQMESHRALPDAFASWARRSIRPALETVERENVEALFSTFSPASNHLLAMQLKRRTGLPWVADFRDLWTEDYRYSEKSDRRRREHDRLQQEILELADIVVGVTARQTEILAGHLPRRKRDKFVTIPNGFDPDDFADPGEAAPRQPHMTLAFVGRLDRWVFHDGFLAALQRFCYALGPKRNRFHLRLVGHVSPDVHERLERGEIRFEHTGHVTHEIAVHEMRTADVLLVCVPDGVNGDSTVPGKLYECLASGKPVLVVGPEGCECGEIVRGCAGGLVSGLDGNAIYTALTRIFRAWSAGQPIPGAPLESIAPFSRITTARQLAEVLDRLVGEGTAESTAIIEEPMSAGALG
ncbi:MAG: glycosyltransferase [Phycisphaerae bacterium]|nr:glycosyltransferase [Phycisphaerae bacterium]